jgi:hypothetical protein
MSVPSAPLITRCTGHPQDGRLSTFFSLPSSPRLASWLEVFNSLSLPLAVSDAFQLFIRHPHRLHHGLERYRRRFDPCADASPLRDTSRPLFSAYFSSKALRFSASNCAPASNAAKHSMMRLP